MDRGRGSFGLVRRTDLRPLFQGGLGWVTLVLGPPQEHGDRGVKRMSLKEGMPMQLKLEKGEAKSEGRSCWRQLSSGAGLVN